MLFLTKRGLDINTTCVWPKNQILRHMLRIPSNSKVLGSPWWSKYRDVVFPYLFCKMLGHTTQVSGFSRAPGWFRSSGSLVGQHPPMFVNIHDSQIVVTYWRQKTKLLTNKKQRLVIVTVSKTRRSLVLVFFSLAFSWFSMHGLLFCYLLFCFAML